MKYIVILLALTVGIFLSADTLYVFALTIIMFITFLIIHGIEIMIFGRGKKQKPIKNIKKKIICQTGINYEWFKII